MFRTPTRRVISTVPIPASVVAALQADALDKRRRALRVAAQQRFDTIGLPRYAYPVAVEVTR